MDNDTLRIVLAGVLGPMFWCSIFIGIDTLRKNCRKRYEETGDVRYRHTSYYVGELLGKLFRGPTVKLRQ